MIIIDTRSAMEFAAGHVAGALNISPEAFLQGLPNELAEVPRDEEIILYCRTGARSNTAANLLTEHGFTNITNGISQGRVEAMLGK